MNRITQKFKDLKKVGKKALIPFITAGDPSLKVTEELVLAFERSGADVIELGVPFSDPLADGPTIQASSQRALDKGVTCAKILQSVKNLRRKTEIPIALMMYYNPIFHHGEKRFVKQVKQAGVDGLIIPDLPPEEAGSLRKICKKEDVSLVFFLSPTTTAARMKKIAKAATGFIYYVSLTGVTGARKQMSQDYIKHIRAAKRVTKTPICVGFGISTPAHVKKVSKHSDGVIVGSAIINEIQKNKGKKNLVSNVARFVKRLVNV